MDPYLEPQQYGRNVTPETQVHLRQLVSEERDHRARDRQGTPRFLGSSSETPRFPLRGSFHRDMGPYKGCIHIYIYIYMCVYIYTYR